MQLLLSQGLFTAFDVYLLGITILTLVVRVELVRNVAAVLRRHRRWPRVRALLVEHWNVLLGRRMLLPVIVYGIVLASNMVVRTFVFPHVSFSFADLAARPVLALPILPLGLVVLARDYESLRETTADFDEGWVTQHLDLAEALLDTVERTERIVRREGLLKRWLVGPVSRAGIELLFVPDANRQLRQLAGQTANKLLFGLSIWVTWALFLS